MTGTASVVMMMSELNIWISVDIKIFNIEGSHKTQEQFYIESQCHNFSFSPMMLVWFSPFALRFAILDIYKLLKCKN